jgi:hypothetical protein
LIPYIKVSSAIKRGVICERKCPSISSEPNIPVTLIDGDLNQRRLKPKIH